MICYFVINLLLLMVILLSVSLWLLESVSQAIKLLYRNLIKFSIKIKYWKENLCFKYDFFLIAKWKFIKCVLRQLKNKIKNDKSFMQRIAFFSYFNKVTIIISSFFSYTPVSCSIDAFRFGFLLIHLIKWDEWNQYPYRKNEFTNIYICFISFFSDSNLLPYYIPSKWLYNALWLTVNQ